MRLRILSNLCRGCMKVFPDSTLGVKSQLKQQLPAVGLIVVRWRKRWLSHYYRQLYVKRTEAGPEPDRHRSVWTNWNYNSEIYAFGRRLGEDFKNETIQRAFIHQSYIEEGERKRVELGMLEGDIGSHNYHNTQLAESGHVLASDYVNSFLRSTFTRFPLDGIRHVHDFLLSEEMMAFVARNIGITDLILCNDFPPLNGTLSKTLFAVIGALLQDQGKTRAELFVRDFIITQLIGKDINELWPIINPMGMLVNILNDQGRPEPEPRLTRHAGDETVMAVYFVGLYCQHELIGEAPGETVSIAEEMAARDALRRIFGTEDSRAPFMFVGIEKREDTDMQQDDHLTNNYRSITENTHTVENST